MSFEKVVFPSASKAPRVIILFKGGSQNDPASYRPLSLLSVFSKIFKKAMLSRLLDFLNSKHFLMIPSLVLGQRTQLSMHV
jgi:hypothetical protein